MDLQQAITEQLEFNLRADKNCAALINACNPANGHGRIQVPGMNVARPVEDRDAWRALAYGVGVMLSNLRLVLTLQAQTHESLSKGFVLTDAEAGRIADLVVARLAVLKSASVPVAAEDAKP